MESNAATPRERAESAAAEWIARRERDDWDGAGEQVLQEWIAADFNNRAAWLRLNAAWQKTARLRSLKTTVPAGVVPAPGEMHLPFFEAAANAEAVPDRMQPKSLTHRRIYAAAAGVAAISLIAGVLYFLFPGASYRTDIGAVQTVPLSDGSRVTLNTRTEIRVDVTDVQRRIRLERGEAYFEVAKDPSRPFVVEAGNRRIVAVGTQFSVRREAADVRVLVTEGAVRVETLKSTQTADSALLTAGAVARAEPQGVLVQRKPVAEVEQALSWRTGYVLFDRAPLKDAVAEFNRYNVRQVRIEDPALQSIPVGGSFRASNVDAFLRLIERELPVQAVEEGGHVVLKGRTP